MIYAIIMTIFLLIPVLEVVLIGLGIMTGIYLASRIIEIWRNICQMKK